MLQISNFRLQIHNYTDQRNLQTNYLKHISDNFKKDTASFAVLTESNIDNILNWDELIKSIDLNTPHLSDLQIPRETLERQPIHIREIISHVQRAEWVIPNFQRYYDWTSENVRQFLTSIFMEYYVGSLLLWRPQEDEKLDCIPVDGVNVDVSEYPLVVLDGQQRITSLSYVMNPPKFNKKRDQNKKFPGYYYVDLRVFLLDLDLEDLIQCRDEKLKDNDTFDKFLFPLYKLNVNDINLWIEDLVNRFSDHSLENQLKIGKIGDRIRTKLFNALTKFEIPLVVLPKTIEFDAVAAIFENLNTKGKRLGTFDLLIVRLSRYGVRLKDLWDDTLDEFPKIEEYFKEKPEMDKLNLYIMESISLAFTKTKSCKRKDILNLFVNNGETVETFSIKWKEMTKYIQRAIEYVEDTKDGFGAVHKQKLPYESIIPILAALLREIDLNFRSNQYDCVKKLHYWYWTSVFDARFSSAVESKKQGDFIDLMAWFQNDTSVPTVIRNFRKDYNSKLHLDDVRSKRSSIYLGVFSLLSKNNATDLERKIIMDNKKHQMDHIFPKSKYKKYDGLQNSILNMTWLTRETNIAAKRDRLPSDYMIDTIAKKYKNNTSAFSETLACHFINDKCLEYLKNDKFEEFLDERERILIKKIGNMIGATSA